jgi:hypothetical protein
MDEIVTCPVCHVSVRPADYFCFNCGRNLHPVPPSTSAGKQALLYIGSFLLPPMGVFWGLPYIRQPDTKSKTVGYIAMGLTVAAIIVYSLWIRSVMNAVSAQMQMFQSLEGF